MERVDVNIQKNMKYLKLLSKNYSTIEEVCREIVNLESILDLPKGTEHFLSDIHGEYEAFTHILNNASGEIRSKIDIAFGNSVSQNERSQLATLIYYPEKKLDEIKDMKIDLADWYKITIHRLLEICVITATKYTRSKLRKALPNEFEYIIDELLHTDVSSRNKDAYYHKIIDAIIEIDRADEFIISLANVIKRLVVDHLHIVGDIYDRGPHPDIIMDMLINHHNVDIQWGNHDILWMGAGAGNLTCIANALNISLQYNNLEFLETGYGISLRKLVNFAQETYADCKFFAPKGLTSDRFLNESKEYISQLHKAVVVMQFKLEGQTILRHPEYNMKHRLFLDKINYKTGEIEIGGVKYKLNDCDFPTIDPKNPYELTEQEQDIMDYLKFAFTSSEKLQKHIQFMFSNGSMYKIYNNNLLLHGCIPMEPNGEFMVFKRGSKSYSGQSYLAYCDRVARNAYFMSDTAPNKDIATDFFWFLWSGNGSPLYGRDKMTTFERYLISDQSLWKETKNSYYELVKSPEICGKILVEFGLDAQKGHIINGHVPVRTKDGESPVRGEGRLIFIDGGFCKAYQKTTGIAGYTLIYNSWGMKLVSHQPFSSIEAAVKEDMDIVSTSTVLEYDPNRIYVANTDTGEQLKEKIKDLKLLLKAYREGYIG